MKPALIFPSLILLALAAASCSKDDPGKKPSSAPPAEAPKPAPPAPPAAANVADIVDGVLAPYEVCRAKLADDDGAVAECAKDIETAAKAHAGDAPDAVRAHLAALGAAAGKLAGMPASDVDALRLAFGRVSEPAVALLMAAPDAAKSYHMFECPMAEGYKRWIQPDSKLANPYMGTKMLECGTEVHDHHAGMKKGGEMDMKHGDMDMKHGDMDMKH